MLYSIKLRRLSLIASAKIERIFILCKYLTRKILKNLKKRAFSSPSDRRFGAVLLRYSALNRRVSPCAPPKPGFAGPRPLLPPPFCRRVRSRDSPRLPEAPRGGPRFSRGSPGAFPRLFRSFPGAFPRFSRGLSRAAALSWPRFFAPRVRLLIPASRTVVSGPGKAACRRTGAIIPYK